MFISINDEHLKNAESSISKTVKDWNIFFFNDVHFEKATFPNDFIEEGIIISVNDEHSLNKLSPIQVIEEGIITCKS